MLRREFYRLGVDVIDMLANGPDTKPVVQCPMLHAISGPDFYRMGTGYSSTKNVGLGFIEDIQAAGRYIENAKFYDHISCGSSWMHEQMVNIKTPCSLSTVTQGVDCDLFQPAIDPRRNGTFNVFCGGKPEFRKGTDIAIAALSRFMSLHQDVHLYAAWFNHWPATMYSLQHSPHIKVDLPEQLFGALESCYYIHRIAVDNGIPADRMHLVPLAANSQMAQYYQMCDVGLFPNRCEAGNNMVMCELMACGVPVVASLGTGHLDVLDDSYCFGIGGAEQTTGWLEPGLEQAIAGLEWAYSIRGAALQSMGRKAREAMLEFTWESAAQQLLEDLDA
jgi:glycosyltransferase involved in cell wall biosynthesis